MSELILQNGHAFASLAPANGGALARFWWRAEDRRIDWLRPAPPDITAGMPANQLGCFPLVPFFGRIRDGLLCFGSHTARLRHNVPGIAHAVHGLGWQRPWRVDGHGADWARLSYADRGGEWPWPYIARQDIRLGDTGGLTATLTLANDGDEPMPAGLGFHPYFPRDDGAVLRARLTSVWQADEQLFPLAERPMAADEDFAVGRAIETLDYDHVFGGWDGGGDIRWRDGRRLIVTAEPAPALVVIVARPGRDFFTFEPVTHLSDAFNHGGHGTVVLAPGEELSLTLRMQPRLP